MSSLIDTSNIDLKKYNIYAANANSDIVSVVNNGKIIKTIQMGMNPVAMAFVKTTIDNNEFIYVVSKLGDISIIQLSDNTVVKKLKLNGVVLYNFNANIIVNNSLSRLYIASANSKSGYNGTVTVINTEEQTIVTSIAVQMNPTVLAMTYNKKYNSSIDPDASDTLPNANKLYVINEGSRSISVIDLISNSVTKSFVVKHSPETIVVTRDNKYFVIGYQHGQEVHFGDVQSDTITGEKKTSNCKTRALAVSRDGKLLYIGGKRSKSGDYDKTKLLISDISNSFHLVDIIMLDRKPADVKLIEQSKIDEYYDAIYVSVFYENKKNYLYKLRRHNESNQITKEKSLHLEHFPGFFAITSDGKYVILSFPHYNKISIFDADSLKLLTDIPIDNGVNIFLIVDHHSN